MNPKPYIADLQAYQPGLPIDVVARQYNLQSEQIIKLASNENPLGMSPKARAALVWSLPESHRYPDQYRLIRALAKKLTADPATIILGNGSNDVLDLVARTFLGPGDEAVSSQHAFSVYVIATQSAGAANVVVPAQNYGHDLAAMRAAITAKTKVIWIANPNNPTGTFIPYRTIQTFLRQVPQDIVVVLDEAYYEYLDDADRIDTVRWIAQHPNLVITRTFSKIYGLAGLRVGYGIASPGIVELLNRVRLPFNTSVPALAAAVAALDDEAFVVRSQVMNQQGKKQLVTGLRRLGLTSLPAHGNFVPFKVADAADMQQKLLSQGVIIRSLAANGMPDWLRVTIGTPDEIRRFLKTLEKLLA